MAKKFNFGKIVEAAGNKYVTKSGDVRGIIDEYISTKCYALNALVSGSIYGGIPNNRSTMFAGIEAVGKSLFTKFICDSSMKMKYHPCYFDTEASVDENTFKSLGWTKGEHYDIFPVKTIDDLRVQMYLMLDKYKEYYDSLSPEEYADREKILSIDSSPFVSPVLKNCIVIV
jgi:hypothetical protein